MISSVLYERTRGIIKFLPLEKLAFAVMMSLIKLWSYFESHSLKVRTNYPL